MYFENLRKSQEIMISSRNPTQWGYFYPTAELVMQDISKNACKVVCKDELTHGVFVLFEGEEPTYARIESKIFSCFFCAAFLCAQGSRLRGVRH